MRLVAQSVTCRTASLPSIAGTSRYVRCARSFFQKSRMAPCVPRARRDSKAADVAGHSEALDSHAETSASPANLLAPYKEMGKRPCPSRRRPGRLPTRCRSKKAQNRRIPERRAASRALYVGIVALIGIGTASRWRPQRACGIGGEVKNDVVRAHGARERVQAERVSLDERGPCRSPRAPR